MDTLIHELNFHSEEYDDRDSPVIRDKSNSKQITNIRIVILHVSLNNREHDIDKNSQRSFQHLQSNE